MDNAQFDDLSRRVAVSATRRTALRLLAGLGLLLGALPAAGIAPDVVAK